ncbi:heterogeneous nuclear ribonucleoprotein 1-like [Capsicum chacoense]
MDCDETKRPRTETNKGKEQVGDSSLRVLFVEDIAAETTEESLREHFNQFGKVIDSVIITNANSGRPWRYGVVTYADSKGANKAYGEYHNINNREVHVKKEEPKEDMHVKGAPKTEKNFIGGLPPFDDDSKKDFSSLGFVISDDEEAVEKVSADGCMHELHGNQVEIKRVEPKSDGAEHASENQLHHGGSISKSHRADSGSVEGFGGAYGGNIGAGHGGYGGYEGYGNYGGYREVAGSYGAGTGLYHPVYGGYGYGGSSYGAPAYGSGTGYASSNRYGSTVGNPAGNDNANTYDNRGSTIGNPAGAEYASENQLHHDGSISKSYFGDSGSVEGFGGAYGGKMGAGHGGYGGYEGYGNGYRKVAGSYGAGTGLYHPVYGGYGYGGSSYGAPYASSNRYGSTVGNSAGYVIANRYDNQGSTVGNPAGYDNANRYGNRGSSDGNSAGYVNANRYGNRGGNPAGYDNANRYGNRGRRGGANANWNNDGKFHPYWK